MSGRKSPFSALLLSMIVPGLGQVYNQETKKGLVIFGSCLALGLLGYAISGLNKISAVLALLLLWISAVNDAYKFAGNSSRANDFYYRRSYVVAMLLLVGPLALPLLWQSSHFSTTARWTWTTIVVAVVLLFVAMPHLMNWLVGRVSRL
jgi:hypothetical protein